MDNSGDSDQSLRTTFEAAENLRRSLEKSYDINSEGYQSKLKNAVSKYEECKRLLQALSLFSPNEFMEDVASSEIKYVDSSSRMEAIC